MKLERCLPDMVFENNVKEVVLEALRVELALASTAKQQVEKSSRSLVGAREKLSNEAKRLAVEVERLKNNREQLFEDYADGKLTKEQYVTAKAELSEGISKAETAIEDINNKLSEQIQPVQQSSKYDILMPYVNAKEVTAEMMFLIKRINVFADNRFEIDFAFSR
jgi:chromosome segregation ATPase